MLTGGQNLDKLDALKDKLVAGGTAWLLHN